MFDGASRIETDGERPRLRTHSADSSNSLLLDGAGELGTKKCHSWVTSIQVVEVDGLPTGCDLDNDRPEFVALEAVLSLPPFLRRDATVDDFGLGELLFCCVDAFMKVQKENDRAAGLDDLLGPLGNVRDLYKFDRLTLAKVLDPTRIVRICHPLVEFFNCRPVFRCEPQRIILGHKLRQLLPQHFLGHTVSAVREYRMVQPLHRRLVLRGPRIPLQSAPARFFGPHLPDPFPKVAAREEPKVDPNRLHPQRILGGGGREHEDVVAGRGFKHLGILRIVSPEHVNLIENKKTPLRHVPLEGWFLTSFGDFLEMRRVPAP